MSETTVVHTTGQSPLDVPSKTVRWEINSFDKISPDNSIILSPVDFGTPTHLTDISWSRQQEMCIRKNPFEQVYTLYLRLRNTTNVEVRHTVKFSSGDPRVETCLPTRTEAVAPGLSSLDISFTLGQLGSVGQHIKRTNSVRIDVELAIVSERTDTKRTITAPGPTLAKSLAACLESDDLKELSDVDIVDEDDGIHPAHSFLLKVRSPHFRALFRHDMQETRTGRILIDKSSDAVDQLLKFIYTDDIDPIINNESLLMEVFDLGGLYALPRLKDLVEMQMKDTLSIDNVAGRLLMCVRHNSPVRTECTKMIKSNIDAVVKTEDWAEIAKDASVMASLMTPDKSDSASSHEDSAEGQKKKKRRKMHS